VETERIEDETARNIVRLSSKNEPAWTRDTDHLTDGSAGIRQVDQDGLAGHEVETGIGECPSVTRRRTVTVDPTRKFERRTMDEHVAVALELMGR
jgi:hypothetical protein